MQETPCDHQSDIQQNDQDMENEFNPDNEFSDCEVRSLFHNIKNEVDEDDNEAHKATILEKPCIVLEDNRIHEEFITNDQNFYLKDDVEDSVEFICQIKNFDIFQSESSKEPDKCEKLEWFKWDNLPQPLMLPEINRIKLGFNPFKST